MMRHIIMGLSMHALVLSASLEAGATATTLANAVKACTRLQLSATKLHARCATDTSECRAQQQLYTTMKVAIDAFVDCVTSPRVGDGCSDTTMIAAIQTSRYVDAVGAANATTDRSVLALIPPFVQLLLSAERRYGSNHHRLSTSIQAVSSRQAPLSETINDQRNDSSGTSHLKNLRLRAWDEL